MSLVLDAGALIALARDERPMWVRLKAAAKVGEVPVTHAGVLGQVWRGGPRQARLAMALRSIDVAPLDEGLGRAAGALLAVTGGSDVVDAALAVLAVDGDQVVTLDTDDLAELLRAVGRHVEVLSP